MGGQDQKDFKDILLRKHNEFRSRHKDTVPVEWNDELAKGAQKWADHLGKIKTLQHDSNLDCGENVFMCGTSGDYTATELAEKCCDKWYAEIANFDFKTKSKKVANLAVGHFTQVVWKDSNKVGAGYCKIKDGEMTKFFVVVRYKPTGNYIGKEAENVMDLK